MASFTGYVALVKADESGTSETKNGTEANAERLAYIMNALTKPKEKHLKKFHEK